MEYPVEDNWSCKRSGDCCTMPSHVVMTDREAAILQEWADKNWTLTRLGTLHFEGTPVPGFVQLRAKPCPFLETVSGKPVCGVRDIRPYNCRRFACLRPDPKVEPLQIVTLRPSVEYSEISCVNARMRLIGSRSARRTYETIQRKAARWARTVGWVE